MDGLDTPRQQKLAPGLIQAGLGDYVDLWRWQTRLKNGTVVDDKAVRAFLTLHKDQVTANRLRYDWLGSLAARGLWADYQSERAALIWDPEPRLSCLDALARLNLVPADAMAKEAARQVALNTAEPHGDAGQMLFDALLAAGVLSPYAAIRALVEVDQLALVQRHASRLSPKDAAVLTQILKNPGEWLTLQAQQPDPRQAEFLVIALLRCAQENPSLAAGHATLLQKVMSAEQQGIVWGRIGYRAALKLLPEAHRWYGLGGAEVGKQGACREEVLAWQVRTALRAYDWKQVLKAIERMPEQAQREEVWVYWRGRALVAHKRTQEARQILLSISDRIDYYGKLAREELDLLPKPTPLPKEKVEKGKKAGRAMADPTPPGTAPEPTAKEVARIRARPGIQRARALLRLGMGAEAVREWYWSLREANERQLLAAAELAHSLGMVPLMISTSERTRKLVHLAQRYPRPFESAVARQASLEKIDPALMYGVMRQESRFSLRARSHAGAQGLMQLMPGTAAYVARSINLPGWKPGRTYEMEVNLRLGGAYLRMVREDLGDPLPLAVAAYNAGPQQVRRWREKLPRGVEGAVFIESIPIHETRDYVKLVMANTLHYTRLATGSESALKSLLGKVDPMPAGETVLP